MKQIYSKTMLNSIGKTNDVHATVENILPQILNKDSLVNFRNNELSYFTGALIYPDKNQGIWFNRGIVKHYFGILKDLYLYKKRGINYLRKKNINYHDFSEDDIGNPIIYNFFNFKETGTNIYNNFLYSMVEKHLRSSKNILEIGSGFGKLASLINMNKNLNYNIIEYPGTAIICEYYLKEKFKKTKKMINFFRDSILKDINNDSINIFPTSIIENNEQLENFKNIDTVLNSESFQHMSERDILFYIQIFKDNKIEKIISINRHEVKMKGECNFFKIFEENGYVSEKKLQTKIDIDFFGLENHYLSVFYKR